MGLLNKRKTTGKVTKSKSAKVTKPVVKKEEEKKEIIKDEDIKKVEIKEEKIEEPKEKKLVIKKNAKVIANGRCFGSENLECPLKTVRNHEAKILKVSDKSVLIDEGWISKANIK